MFLFLYQVIVNFGERGVRLLGLFFIKIVSENLFNFAVSFVEYKVHAYNRNGLCAVGFMDDHYPIRSAFSLLNQVRVRVVCFGLMLLYLLFPAHYVIIISMPSYFYMIYIYMAKFNLCIFSYLLCQSILNGIVQLEAFQI